MLQQTQVATVIPYFQRFVERFPTVQALAEADEQAVLTLWQGLGYYRRARHLHAAARAIVAEHAGQVPDTVEGLLQLPGVGRYTAGAVASIAFGRPAPIVDGNVARVFARFYGIDEPVDRPTGQKRLWSLAEQVVKAGNLPGDVNQGLMELGALVCTPKSAKCLYCPLRERCKANELGQVDMLPFKLGKAKIKSVTHLVMAIQRRGKFLFEQRPTEGLWSNMWQLPTLEGQVGNEFTDDLRGLTAWVEKRFGLVLDEVKVVDSFDHATTHRAIRLEVWKGDVVSGRLRRGSGEWRKLDQLADLPLSNPQRRAVGMVQG